VSDQVHDFSPWTSSAMEATKEREFGIKVARAEDDVRTSNTRTAQRKHVIAHLRMKNKTIECCNNTHQGAPHTGRMLALQTSVMVVTLLVYINFASYINKIIRI